MKALGRNGKFSVYGIDVFSLNAEEGLAVGLVGKRGAMSCWINGTPDEMVELCKRIFEKCATFKAEVFKSLNKIEE